MKPCNSATSNAWSGAAEQVVPRSRERQFKSLARLYLWRKVRARRLRRPRSCFAGSIPFVLWPGVNGTRPTGPKGWGE